MFFRNSRIASSIANELLQQFKAQIFVYDTEYEKKLSRLSYVLSKDEYLLGYVSCLVGLVVENEYAEKNLGENDKESIFLGVYKELYGSYYRQAMKFLDFYSSELMKYLQNPNEPVKTLYIQAHVDASTIYSLALNREIGFYDCGLADKMRSGSDAMNLSPVAYGMHQLLSKALKTAFATTDLTYDK